MFRKDFYIEVPELTKMSDAEVDDYRTEMEGIKVSGLLLDIIITLMFNEYFSAKERMSQNLSRIGLSAVLAQRF